MDSPASGNSSSKKKRAGIVLAAMKTRRHSPLNSGQRRNSDHSTKKVPTKASSKAVVVTGSKMLQHKGVTINARGTPRRAAAEIATAELISKHSKPSSKATKVLALFDDSPEKLPPLTSKRSLPPLDTAKESKEASSKLKTIDEQPPNDDSPALFDWETQSNEADQPAIQVDTPPLSKQKPFQVQDKDTRVTVKAITRNVRTKKTEPVGNTYRPPNFGMKEDLMLCHAFVNVSHDPIKGSDQKGDVFWSSVRDKFNELASRDSEVSVSLAPPRSLDSLRNRFQRHITKEVQKFNAHYKFCKDKNPSGCVDEDIFERACTRFKEFEGKPFRFSHCVDTLHKMVKFQPMYKSCSSSKDDMDDIPDDSPMTDFNKISTVMGEHHERPIGHKKAKKLLKEASSQALSNNEQIDRVAASNERLAAAMEERNRISQSNLMKNQSNQMKNHYLQVAEMWLKMGNKDMAERFLAKASSDDAPTTATVSSTHNTQVPAQVQVPAYKHTSPVIAEVAARTNCSDSTDTVSLDAAIDDVDDYYRKMNSTDDCENKDDTKECSSSMSGN
jgi:No apical meristem-associated C-terminal domain